MELKARQRAGARGHHFKTIPGLGIKKLGPNEAVKEINHQNNLNGRRIRRKTNEMETIDIKRLDEHEKREYLAGLFVGRISTRIMMKKNFNKITAQINEKKLTAINYEDLIDAYVRKR